MTSKKSHIFAEQITLFHNVKGWYPPVSEVVKGLTAEQAKWKEGVNHSIWELLAHLTFWNERWLKRFLAESVDQLETNEATFFKEEADQGDPQAAGLLEPIEVTYHERIRKAPSTRCVSGLLYAFGSINFRSLPSVGESGSGV